MNWIGEDAVALAARIAALAPLSLRGNKRVLQALIPPLDPALEAELEALRARPSRPRTSPRACAVHREAPTALAGRVIERAPSEAVRTSP